MASNLVFCGTYTNPSAQAGFEVSPERPMMGMTGPTGSEGIYVFRREAKSVVLRHVHAATGVVNPSFLALDRSERWLFAVNEVREFGGAPSGAVSSFAVDQATGSLHFISQVRTGGGNPCHLSVSPTGRHLLVANHEAGNVAVLPIDTEGRLSPPSDVRVDEPVDGRPAHAHFVTPDPAGKFVLSSDTGTDRVSVYRLDEDVGRLVHNDSPSGQTHLGGSPRHLAFSPDGAFLFANGEADMTLSVFSYDAERGELRHLTWVSTLDAASSSIRRSTAQIQVHRSGRFVYVSNRGDDNIAVFRFNKESAAVRRIANEPSRGRTPRNFTIDPSGQYLYVANQNSDRIDCFAIDQGSGLLQHICVAASVPAPTCILFAGAPTSS